MTIHQPIVILSESGLYCAFFTGWWDWRDIGEGWRAGVARDCGGQLSHGLLGDDEVILTPVPEPVETKQNP